MGSRLEGLPATWAIAGVRACQLPETIQMLVVPRGRPVMPLVGQRQTCVKGTHLRQRPGRARENPLEKERRHQRAHVSPGDGGSKMTRGLLGREITLGSERFPHRQHGVERQDGDKHLVKTGRSYMAIHHRTMTQTIAVSRTRARLAGPVFARFRGRTRATAIARLAACRCGCPTAGSRVREACVGAEQQRGNQHAHRYVPVESHKKTHSSGYSAPLHFTARPIPEQGHNTISVVHR